MQHKIVCIFFGITIIALSCKVKKNNQKKEPKTRKTTSYITSIKPIIQTNCVSCHSGKNPAGGIALGTYKEVRFQTEKGKLLTRINNNTHPMPPNGIMTKELRMDIMQWAKDSFWHNDYNAASNQSDTLAWIFNPPTISPIDISKEGFEFFNLMQGHWVGDMNIMGTKYDWFSFDYRPISPMHIHGIYEGGTIGNLFTSFFIANFKGTKTIMARNGGILNGIYRTSYFVLDKVELTNKRNYFRLIDAYGGKDIMWMELEFIEDKLHFNSYTSRFGMNGKPKQHMRFNASKKHIEISNKVAKQLNYPQNKTEINFSNGLPTPVWDKTYPTITSASYIYKDTFNDLVLLGKLAGDPYPINKLPFLTSLKVNIEQNDKTKNNPLIIYLSKAPLTLANGKIILENGYIKQSLFDGVLSFPEITPNQTQFTFYYLHPSYYYLTVVADINRDGFISKGDVTSKSQFVYVNPKMQESITVKNINTDN